MMNRRPAIVKMVNRLENGSASPIRGSGWRTRSCELGNNSCEEGVGHSCQSHR